MKHWQSTTAEIEDTIINSVRFGLITDMDGTISPIVAKPDEARVTPRIHTLLEALLPHLALLAVVSGRSIADLRKRLDLPGLVYVGNHGLEWKQNAQIEVEPEVRSYRPALEAALEALSYQQKPGMLVEDKGATISVHYRQVSDPAAVYEEFYPVIEQISKQHGLRLFKGRMVFELRPPIDTNKGTALKRLIKNYDLDSAIYMGDDTTDADALQIAQKLRHEGVCDSFGMAVLSSDTPTVLVESADLSLLGVGDVERFLSWLLNARSASTT